LAARDRLVAHLEGRAGARPERTAAPEDAPTAVPTAAETAAHLRAVAG
jgi:hypothetical protein